jgi:uncharacterized phage protein gp47/JayE
MTFVAQPYERFVDDLLTALTGGVIREEHQFTGVDGSYTLTTTGVRSSTVRVFGQRNESYVLFDPGIDYKLTSVDAGRGIVGIAWEAQGKLPDDRSYFYVNYYREEGNRTLTDRNPGSVGATLSEAFGREMAVLHKQIEGVYRSGFVDLATGSALDQVVALLGLSRKDAKFASGEVVFRRSTPAPGDIAIPAGTLVSTDLGQNFETTDNRTLRRGQLAVVVPIRAQLEGPAGKVDAAAIKNINRPIFGLEQVSNEAATFFVTEKETDEELRRRLKGTLERAGKASLDAIRYALIEDLPEITETNIQVAERGEVPGFVEVKLGLDLPDDLVQRSALVQRIEESIFGARPAGIRVTHNLPTQTPGGGTSTSTGGISRDQATADFAAQNALVDAQEIAPDVLAAMPQGVVNLQVEVFLRLAQANLAAAQKEAIEDGVRATIRDYVEALPMGAPLVHAKLLSQIVQPETILDARMLVGAANGGTFAGVGTNLNTAGRKARIDPSALFVGLMDEEVRVSLVLTVEASAQSNGALDAATLRTMIAQDSALFLVLKGAAETALATARTTLTRTALEGALRPVLAAASPALQFAPTRGLVLSAEYVETGRLLNDTDQIALADNERARLAKLTVKDNVDV